MSNEDFVDPEIVRLPLANGRFIDVKKQLSHGERDDFYAAIAPFDVNGVGRLDRKVLRTTRVSTWLVGWSLTKGDKPVPMSPEMSEADRVSTIRQLSPTRFDEIHAAILKHEQAMEAEAEAEKNAQGTPTESVAI